MVEKFEKHETLFTILLIVVYLVSNSLCIRLFGEISLEGALLNAFLSLFFFGIVCLLKKISYYGFTKVKNPKEYLYFLPLLLIVSVNLWGGFSRSASFETILFHVLTMISVGFAEELLFRGFLFRMMEKGNVKTAIGVSSVTFGVGHIINLLNGSDFLPTLFQIVYAISIGYLFCTIFYKSNSLIPCILTHSLFNSLSVFHVEGALSLYVEPIFLTAIPLLYARYLNLKIPDNSR